METAGDFVFFAWFWFVVGVLVLFLSFLAAD